MSIDILTTINHDRKIFKGKYIYPVVSRRAGGLSLGINLNTNSACNWQCIYCEVPNLVRGKPDLINLQELEIELDYWLDQIVNKSFNSNSSINEISNSNNDDFVNQLKQLNDLYKSGVLTKEEFEKAKKKILN